MRQVRSGTWEFRVTVGRWSDGRPRTLYRTIEASGEAYASAQLVSFVDEMRSARQPSDRSVRELTVDEAIEIFLTEYLGNEKGREAKTINDYRMLHQKWFSPGIGAQRVNRVETATMDRLFGAMRQAGLSASRLNQAKSLYRPFFRWAKRRGITIRDPMVDFEVPTSTYLSTERTPPEIEQLSTLLTASLAVVPDIAPLLTLGAVTGMRRGELVGIRRSRVLWTELRIVVDTAVTSSKRVKGPQDAPAAHLPVKTARCPFRAGLTRIRSAPVEARPTRECQGTLPGWRRSTLRQRLTSQSVVGRPSWTRRR